MDQGAVHKQLLRRGHNLVSAVLPHQQELVERGAFEKALPGDLMPQIALGPVQGNGEFRRRQLPDFHSGKLHDLRAARE